MDIRSNKILYPFMLNKDQNNTEEKMLGKYEIGIDGDIDIVPID